MFSWFVHYSLTTLINNLFYFVLKIKISLLELTIFMMNALPLFSFPQLQTQYFVTEVGCSCTTAPLRNTGQEIAEEAICTPEFSFLALRRWSAVSNRSVAALAQESQHTGVRNHPVTPSPFSLCVQNGITQWEEQQAGDKEGWNLALTSLPWLLTLQGATSLLQFPDI
jgi:hypothetical protein